MKKDRLPTRQIQDHHDDQHCMPMDDIIEHDPSANCDCGPSPDTSTVLEVHRASARVVWVHRCLREEWNKH